MCVCVSVKVVDFPTQQCYGDIAFGRWVATWAVLFLLFSQKENSRIDCWSQPMLNTSNTVQSLESLDLFSFRLANVSSFFILFYPFLSSSSSSRSFRSKLFDRDDDLLDGERDPFSSATLLLLSLLLLLSSVREEEEE